MESFNFIKGYDKVNPVDDHPNHPPNRRRKIIVALSIAFLLLITVAICSLVAVVIIESATELEESEETSQLASNSANALRTVCAVTRFPDSCFSSISPLNSPPSHDPLRFFNLSLQASAIALSSLKSRIAKPEADPAMKDCAELFDDAASQLALSAKSIRVEHGEKVLTEMRISDLQTWISAAMTDLQTCLDGMAETGSTAGSEFRVRVQRSQEHASNTLAILNNISSLFKKFGISMP